MPHAPVEQYPTAVAGQPPSGIDLGALFPAIIPQVERSLWEIVKAACEAHTVFPVDGTGITLPAIFNIPALISLYAGQDGSYTIPVGANIGQPVPPIPVNRGWVAYPGTVPAIGIAETTSNDDPGDDSLTGGFAGDVNAYDADGNVIATCAYYAEPMSLEVVVELIHENRDERDRLTDQLRQVLQPLKHQYGRISSQIRSLNIGVEKQDLPQDDLPRPVYVSIFTLTVTCEALIPTAITPTGLITAIDIGVNASITPLTQDS